MASEIVFLSLSFLDSDAFALTRSLSIRVLHTVVRLCLAASRHAKPFRASFQRGKIGTAMPGAFKLDILTGALVCYARA